MKSVLEGPAPCSPLPDFAGVAPGFAPGASCYLLHHDRFDLRSDLDLPIAWVLHLLKCVRSSL